MNVAAHREAELAYVVVPNILRCTEVAKRYGATPCSDPQQALLDTSVDAVLTFSATNTHVGLMPTDTGHFSTPPTRDHTVNPGKCSIFNG